MSLTYCEGCHQLEGDTVECEESGETACAECGELVTRVPEHDWDEER